MKDAGFAIMESMDAAIYDNKVENVRYGLRISLGGAGNQIYDNTFDGCSDCENVLSQGTAHARYKHPTDERGHIHMAYNVKIFFLIS